MAALLQAAVSQTCSDGLLVFIHGLAATSRVWLPMIETINDHWNGRWAAIDLRGHGMAIPGAAYAIEDYAGDIARFIEATGESRVTLLGHSLGGSVALAAAAMGPPLESVFSLGVKIDWSADELASMRARSERPARCFASRAEALAQHARECGLDAGASAHADANIGQAMLATGVVAVDGGWRTAMDRAAYAIEPPDMDLLMAQARCPVHLACGERDMMVNVGRLRDHDPGATAIAAAGHNAMIDAPEGVWGWLDASR